MTEADKISNKIQATKKSIKKSDEWLKWNKSSVIYDEIKSSNQKREKELQEYQKELDSLFENQCICQMRN